MADKGIIVDDASTGESVACIDLRNSDDDTNSRVVQLTSNVTSPQSIVNCEDGTPTRTLDFSTSVGDDVNVSAAGIESGITNNLLDISDSECFVVYGKIGSGGDAISFGAIKLVPILFPDTTTKPGILLPGALLRVEDASLIIDTTSGAIDAPTAQLDDPYLVDQYDAIAFQPMVFPTLGAKYVGFHLRANQSIDATVKLYAYKLTGAAAFAALNTLHVTENKLSSPHFYFGASPM